MRVVKLWDVGKPIQHECKRLVRVTKGRELAASGSRGNFKMHKDAIELSTGQLVEPQEILIGIALLEIQSPSDA